MSGVDKMAHRGSAWPVAQDARFLAGDQAWPHWPAKQYELNVEAWDATVVPPIGTGPYLLDPDPALHGTNGHAWSGFLPMPPGEPIVFCGVRIWADEAFVKPKLTFFLAYDGTQQCADVSMAWTLSGWTVFSCSPHGYTLPGYVLVPFPGCAFSRVNWP